MMSLSKYSLLALFITTAFANPEDGGDAQPEVVVPPKTCQQWRDERSGACPALVHPVEAEGTVTCPGTDFTNCEKTCCLERAECFNDGDERDVVVDVLECKHCKCGHSDSNPHLVRLKSVFDPDLKNTITKRADCRREALAVGAKYYNWYESRMVDEDRCIFGVDSQGQDTTSEENCGKEGRSENTRRPWQIWSVRYACSHNCAEKVAYDVVAAGKKCAGLNRLAKWQAHHQMTETSLQECAKKAYAAGAKYFSYNDITTETETNKKWCYYNHKWSSDEACIHNPVTATGSETAWGIYHPYCNTD